MKPHKHCELIKAWADGAAIQYRNHHSKAWADCVGNPVWDTLTEYRVKPQTIKYRVALFEDNSIKSVNAYLDVDGALLIENSASFVRWLTDWIEVEV